MGGTIEILIVLAVVAVAVFWALRALIRTVRKTGGCSSCASSGDCPAAKGGRRQADPPVPVDFP
jgi:hypothetical protein